MRSIVFIQNLFSPYRSYFFNSLYKKVPNFKVYYMGKTEKDRSWDYNKIDMSHPYWLDKWGFYFMLFGYHIHINPVLVCKVAFCNKISDVILGVSYNDFNILILAFLKHLRLTKSRFHFWAEANYLTIGARKDSTLKRWLRKFVYSAVDGYFIVPGKMSVETFERWGFLNNKYIFVPNTIDEANMIYDAESKKCNRCPMFLLPVRLNEKIKGILNFFNSIGVDNIKKARFIIAGDGPDYDSYMKYIVSNKLQDHIELKGFCDSKEMNSLYNMVDAIILPSFSDPSPLSLVEALRFHLPILCSSHCGNHFEAVEAGINGFVFSPLDSNEIKEKFEFFINSSSKWKEMGNRSWEKYCSTFETNQVVNNLMRDFI